MISAGNDWRRSWTSRSLASLVRANWNGQPRCAAFPAWWSATTAPSCRRTPCSNGRRIARWHGSINCAGLALAKRLRGKLKLRIARHDPERAPAPKPAPCPPSDCGMARRLQLPPPPLKARLAHRAGIPPTVRVRPYTERNQLNNADSKAEQVIGLGPIESETELSTGRCHA